MEKEQLLATLKKLEETYENDRKKILKEYALSKNPFKQGDIITDHIGSVKFERIGFYMRKDIAECTYTGAELKKDGTPKKNGSVRTVYQSNII